MLTQTRLVLTSFRIVSGNPDKMGRYLVVIPATNRANFSRRPTDMYLSCLGEFEELAADWDGAKIVVASMAPGYLYE